MQRISCNHMNIFVADEKVESQIWQWKYLLDIQCNGYSHYLQYHCIALTILRADQLVLYLYYLKSELVMVTCVWIVAQLWLYSTVYMPKWSHREFPPSTVYYRKICRNYLCKWGEGPQSMHMKRKIHKCLDITSTSSPYYKNVAANVSNKFINTTTR